MIGLLLSVTLAMTPVQARTASEAESRLALRDFARCILSDSPDAAADLLAVDFDSEAYRTGLRDLAKRNEDCLGFYQRARFNNVLLAGALAEELIARRKVDVAKAIAFDAARPVLQSRNDMETTALCLAFEHPASVAGLLSAKPASGAEAEAFKMVVAKLPACLPKGQGLRTNYAGLRAILATAAFRIIRTDLPARSPSSGS